MRGTVSWNYIVCSSMTSTCSRHRNLLPLDRTVGWVLWAFTPNQPVSHFKCKWSFYLLATAGMEGQSVEHRLQNKTDSDFTHVPPLTGCMIMHRQVDLSLWAHFPQLNQANSTYLLEWLMWNEIMFGTQWGIRKWELLLLIEWWVPHMFLQT